MVVLKIEKPNWSRGEIDYLVNKRKNGYLNTSQEESDKAILGKPVFFSAPVS